jgi:hypothetical protein
VNARIAFSARRWSRETFGGAPFSATNAAS